MPGPRHHPDQFRKRGFLIRSKVRQDEVGGFLLAARAQTRRRCSRDTGGWLHSAEDSGFVYRLCGNVINLNLSVGQLFLDSGYLFVNVIKS